MKTPHYCCIETECNHAQLIAHEDGLQCSKGHFFPFISGTKVPIFKCEDEGANEYAQKESATIHDNALRWVLNTFETNEETLRKSLISRLHLTKGKTILITGAGAGNDLPFLAQSMEMSGTIYAQDISKQMLLTARERYENKLNSSELNLYFSVSDATDLPFNDNLFDAAYHFGGINLFPDIKKGISEMNRVVKPEGLVLISDEGIAPWLKTTELGKMLINNNPLYVYDAPLELIPSTAKSVKLSWELSHCFYVIEFTVSKDLPQINIDVPHIGKRGGSIRTRYHGQLEGIDPSLRNKIYAEAEKKGMSRVEYLEKLIKDACQ